MVEHVAAWFVDGHGLTPGYDRLPEGDPVAGLISLLELDPDAPLQTFVPEGSFASSGEREGSDSLQVELSGSFWNRPAGEVYAGAAQVINTLATLEEGKTIVLLDGTVPGEILDGSFEPIEQPLTRESFVELRPWFVVEQPVAGAVVGARLPIRITSDGDMIVSALILRGDDDPVGGNNSFAGETTIELQPGLTGRATLFLKIIKKRTTHTTSMPLELRT